MNEMYRTDVARSKEIGDYYRDLSLNYRLYDEWNTTPVGRRDWDNPMYWPTNPHPEAMKYLERYFDEKGQQVKGALLNDALATT
jgi:hypothetical protein